MSTRCVTACQAQVRTRSRPERGNGSAKASYPTSSSHVANPGLTSRPPSLPCHDHRGGIPTSCEVPSRVLSATLHPSLTPVACCSRILRFPGFECLSPPGAASHPRILLARLQSGLVGRARLLSGPWTSPLHVAFMHSMMNSFRSCISVAWHLHFRVSR